MNPYSEIKYHSGNVNNTLLGTAVQDPYSHKNNDKRMFIILNY